MTSASAAPAAARSAPSTKKSAPIPRGYGAPYSAVIPTGAPVGEGGRGGVEGSPILIAGAGGGAWGKRFDCATPPETAQPLRLNHLQNHVISSGRRRAERSRTISNIGAQRSGAA